jgi:Uri superfamily endonuclease
MWNAICLTIHSNCEKQENTKQQQINIHVSNGYFKYLGSANQNKTAILVIENLGLGLGVG